MLRQGRDHTEGRCNLDIKGAHVIGKILAKIREVGPLWHLLANVYWHGLAKLDIAGKRQGKGTKSSVTFIKARCSH